MSLNYYQILGVNEEATADEIKKAYNNMIKAFHPDYYRGSDKKFAEEKTKELNEAYEVLIHALGLDRRCCLLQIYRR